VGGEGFPNKREAEKAGRDVLDALRDREISFSLEKFGDDRWVDFTAPSERDGGLAGNTKDDYEDGVIHDVYDPRLHEEQTTNRPTAVRKR
jgi:hypothetical protein